METSDAIPDPKPPIDVEMATRLYRDAGFTYREIGRRMGYSVQAVRRAVAQAGVETREVVPPPDAPYRLQIESAWRSMLLKCQPAKSTPNDGDASKAIPLHPPWSSFDMFYRWALTSGYRPKLRLLRKDFRRGFKPDNCHWVTASEHMRHRTKEPDSHYPLTAFGETKGLFAWDRDRRCQVSAAILRHRIMRGVDPEVAMSTPYGGRVAERALGDWTRKPTPLVKPRPLPLAKLKTLYTVHRMTVSAIAKRLHVRGNRVYMKLKAEGLLSPRQPRLRDRLHGRRLRAVWRRTRRRCEDPRDVKYRHYGKLGARVCAEWKDFEAFYTWALRTGFRPGQCLSRRDLDGPFSPTNCHWVTRRESVQDSVRPIALMRPRWNVRALGVVKGPTAWSRDFRCQVSLPTLLSRLRSGMPPEKAITMPSRTAPKRAEPRVPVTAFGETKGLTEWCRDLRCQVKMATLRTRLHQGMDPEKALTTPPFRPIPSKAKNRGAPG